MRSFFISIVLVFGLFTSAHAATLNIVQHPVSFGYKTASGRTIDTVIIHATYNPALATQTLDGALAEWKANNVSPHYAIDRDGTIYQLVAEKNIAWHAGVSTLPNGATNVNTRSIGIEMVYSNTDTPSDAQYASLQALISDIESRYHITYVLGHSQIAPGRKVDPWNFDYTRIAAVIPSHSTSSGQTAISSMFHSNVTSLTTNQKNTMKLYSYRASCPVSLTNLRAVSVSYYDFNGAVQQGTLIVNKTITAKTVAAFKVLFAQQFPINKITPIDAYKGDDTASMAADNTSAFNCRPVAGTKVFSEHAYGTAIDINPKENVASASPAVALAKEGQGVLTSAAVQAVKSAGFKWGGDWTSKKDYQHFSISGK